MTSHRCTVGLLAIMSLLVLPACDGEANKSSDSVRRPAPEETFLNAKSAVSSRFEDAPNDVIKHQIAHAWRQGGTCAALKSAQFTDWVGTISTITYDGTLSVDLGDGVTLEGSITTRQASHLQEGDTVAVSGAFAPKAVNKLFGDIGDALGGKHISDCPALAMTDDVTDQDTGTVESPQFNVHFSHVSDQH